MKLNSILLLALLVAFCIKIYMSFSPKDTQKNIYKIELSTIENNVTLIGTIHSKQEVYIVPHTNGYIKKLYVKQGDFVKKNDPLVTMVENLLFTRKRNPIRSPYDGYVTLINKTEGEYLITNTSVENFILKLEDLNSMYLNANATENDITKITKRQEALIKVNSIPNISYTGIVEDFALGAKTEQSNWRNTKSVFPVKIIITTPDNNLRSGMSALADIVIQKKENIITIPNEFLCQEHGVNYVTMKDGTKRNVKIGIITSSAYEIVEGLKVGEEIQGVNYFEN